MKKIVSFILVFMTALLVSSTVYATPVAKGDATMSLVKDEVANIEFGKFGKFEKKMADIDLANKTIDIKLTVTNDQLVKDDEVTETVTNVGQVVFLIDGSKSMLDDRMIGGKTTTRQQVVIDSAKQLANELFKANEKMKIGIVEFATSPVVSETGGDNDAVIITPSLVNNLNDFNTAIDTLETNKMGNLTNLEVGLEKAEALLNKEVGEDEGKYIVVLTDAIPTAARGLEYTYSKKVFNQTKDKLLDLEKKDIDVISLLIEMEDIKLPIYTQDPEDPTDTTPTYKQVAESIFGTVTNPTVGPVYYVPDDKVAKTITDDILEALTETKTTTIPGEKYVLTDIVIKDYIPQNYVDNFDFSYLVKPEIGKVTDKIDTSDKNSITWTIPELNPGETATLTYRLSLKNTFDNSIIAINLPTNTDVTVDYLENGEKGETKHNDKCPVVILDVEAKKKIPQTGSNTWFTVGLLITTAVVIGGISFINYKRLYK